MFGRKSVKKESEPEVTDPTADPTVRDIAHIRNYAHRLRLAAEAEDAARDGDTDQESTSAVEEPSEICATDNANIVDTTDPADADESVSADESVDDDMPATPAAHELVDVPPALARAAASVSREAKKPVEKPAVREMKSTRQVPVDSQPAQEDPSEDRVGIRAEVHNATSPMVTTQTTPRPRQSIAPILEPAQPVPSQPMYVARPEPVNAADSNDALRMAQVGVGTVGGVEDGDEAVSVRNIAIQGVTFRAPRAISPGTIRQIKMDTERATLASKIRVVSCKLRGDGSFDIKAEFF